MHSWHYYLMHQMSGLTLLVDNVMAPDALHPAVVGFTEPKLEKDNGKGQGQILSLLSRVL